MLAKVAFLFSEINQKVEAVERKYQAKLNNTEDGFNQRLREKEMEFEELMNRKNGVRIAIQILCSFVDISSLQAQSDRYSNGFSSPIYPLNIHRCKC